jgi:hypothetical protein
LALFTALGGASAACSSGGNGNGGGSGGTGGTPAAVTITVSQAPANVLTCTTVPFSATVTNATDTTVTWAMSPTPGWGTIGADGTYTAPTVAPTAPANIATVTATSVADPTKSATTSAFLLGTAFPGGVVAMAGSTGAGEPGNPAIGVYQHRAASNGRRMYATWADNPPAPATEVRLMVSRSDDGGATWSAGVPAIDATTATTGSVDCPAIAVDPGNADVVYATATVDVANSLSAAMGDYAGPALVMSVSTDGGATFTPVVLSSAFATFYACQDVAAPAADTVVVTVPGHGCEPGADSPPDMFVWSDAARGAGFTSGAHDTNGAWWANGLTGGLDRMRGDATCADDLAVYANGADGGSGQVIESPRMFVDGRSSRLCLAYAATAAGSAAEGSYVQCSSDAGQTFTDPVLIDPATLTDNQPSGTMGPGGVAAMAWTTATASDNQQALVLATSTNAGASFTAPIQVPTADTPYSPSLYFDESGILWIAYMTYDGSQYSVFVDKSCDGGATFSGPVRVNGAATYNLLSPTLLGTGGLAPVLVGAQDTTTAAFSLSP